jgi:predicted transcriptional regulator
MAQEPKGVHLSVRTDKSTKHALGKLARKRYLTLSQVILEALREKIEKEKK